jgi:hypothetical protein
MPAFQHGRTVSGSVLIWGWSLPVSAQCLWCNSAYIDSMESD